MVIDRGLFGEGDDIPLSYPIWFASLDFLQRWLSHFPAGTLATDNFSNNSKDESPRKYWQPVHIDHVHYTLAVKCLEDGKDGFLELCRRWLKEKRVNPRFGTGLTQDFEPVHELLRGFPVPDFSHFHDWLDGFLSAEWTGGYLSHTRFPLPDSPQSPLHGHVGIQHASELLRCRSESVVQLLKSGVVSGSVLPLGTDGKVRALVDVDSVQRALERRQAAIPLHEASAMTGFAPDVLSALYYHRVLPAERGPITDGQAQIMFHRPAIDLLIARLRDNSLPLADDMAPLSGTNGVQIAEVIQGILIGTRRAHVITSGGRVLQCYVSPECVQPSVASESGLEEDAMGFEEAATLLGITPALLQKLVDERLLTLDGQRVLGVHRFREDYVWEADAASLIGVVGPSFHRWVAWQRIFPMLVLGKALLFEKSSLIPFLPENRCTVKEAALILGVPNPQDVHRRFIDKKGLRPIAGPGIDGGSEFLLSRPEVIALAEGGLPPLISAREAALALEINYFTLLKRLRRGEIPAKTGPSIDGSPSYSVDRAVLLALNPKAHLPTSLAVTLNKMGAPPNCSVVGAPTETVTTAEAAQMLGLTVPEFHVCIRRPGLLMPCGRLGSSGHLFRKSEVESIRFEVAEHGYSSAQTADEGYLSTPRLEGGRQK